MIGFKMVSLDVIAQRRSKYRKPYFKFLEIIFFELIVFFASTKEKINNGNSILDFFIASYST